jgi:prepilin-type N-terminal cleavage/methylation domain-containing protein
MSSGANRKGFTILEVMLAVMVMALVIVAIYRMVTTSLQSIKISIDDDAQKGAVQALAAVLQEELSNLPAGEANALLGQPHKFNGLESDEIEWLTQAGNGLFTEAANGSWKATLILKPQDKTNTYTLGLMRTAPDDNTGKDQNWVPLLPNVDAIEIRYFFPQLNAWQDTWSDSQSLPSMVRFRIWRTGQTVPYETVIALPPTRLPAV